MIYQTLKIYIRKIIAPFVKTRNNKFEPLGGGGGGGDHLRGSLVNFVSEIFRLVETKSRC